MKYFSIEELCKTNYDVDNTPDIESKLNLIKLVDNVLDPLREALGMPIKVNSGYRCEELNKKVGGSKTSQHKTGCAADITCKDNKKLYELCKTMDYDQLIWEYGDDEKPYWVHISYAGKDNRHQELKAVKIKGKTIYERVK